ncbi:hypothetical protein LZF95_23760 [Algoriphagus sp. AGSA1]|uniref:hypothetical protein n=1 Tax=Algoriphagus sp. AGSA1 TaxID=2907213 RepID=UPI001F16C363|nr:hypothetical protein [Algoriphagus sp. AGSA1]MCE7057720.1 hypothetical protein [Algoriphagus sp. AGSA1]
MDNHIFFVIYCFAFQSLAGYENAFGTLVQNASKAPESLHIGSIMSPALTNLQEFKDFLSATTLKESSGSFEDFRHDSLVQYLKDGFGMSSIPTGILECFSLPLFIRA